jgi:dTDP-4-amino-4,6-dideoxygalactose transaminase
MARPQNKVVVTGAFQEIAGLMESIERKGRARESETEKIVTELGQKLSTALVDMAGGIKHMNEIMEFINERKEPGVK